MLLRFELAVADFLSVDLWLEYCSFEQAPPFTVRCSARNTLQEHGGSDEESIAATRAVFERAVTAAGDHLTEGAEVWAAFRRFECQLLEKFTEQQMLSQRCLPACQRH